MRTIWTAKIRFGFLTGILAGSFLACADDTDPLDSEKLRERLNAVEQAITSLSAGPQTVRFNRDVRPILAEHCFKCHGPDEKQRKADFRLDVREAALKALAPGKPEESEVVKRVTSHDGTDRMPPPDAKAELTPKQIDTLTTWIKEGARYEPHWAFIKPQRPAVPAVKHSAWPRNPIDNFVLARLDANNVAPSSDADRRTLIRRVYLDLIGTPPAPEAVDAFLNDAPSDAYEKVVDGLLASPHLASGGAGIGWTRRATRTAMAMASTGRATFGSIGTG